ncbi:MAG: DUF1501 domain-containing protein [Planctomycetes bacterium]|nr:DUF1501 domain-containing protein [Planctomycetota bacterium]
MLTIFSKPHTQGGFCDGLNRRDFLTIGGTIAGGLMLPDLLRAEVNQGRGTQHKAIINIYLPGGPPHQDMWDIKTEAPREIRGEFNPIRTNVNGIEICELFPRIAANADKFVFVRSIVDADGRHDGYQCMTGRRKDPQKEAYWPMMGSWVSRFQGPVNQSIPPNVALMYATGESRWGDPYHGGFLGMGHNPFNLVGGRNNMAAANMTLNGVTMERLNDRMSLMRSFDGMRRDIDRSGAMDGIDSFQQQALGILTSSRLVDALDLSKEDRRVVERYGFNDPAFERDGAPRMVRNFCIARRLVEAGARVVTLNFSRWDWHGPDGKNFVESRRNMPLLDAGVSALVEDLDVRGLLNDVSIVVWGEFGRTPRINNTEGRDHWPQLSCALMAGGGMRTGQVIGASDRTGGTAARRPVKFQEVFATLYRNIGLNPGETRIFDPNGRPQYLVDQSIEPIGELN